MKRETLKTSGFACAALILAVAAAWVAPERHVPKILSDQGELFYPNFTNPSAAKTIEVVDYDEATATARPFQVDLQRGRWVIPTHHNYPVDVSDRLLKTAAALVELRKDVVVSDSAQDHSKHAVVDPLESKNTNLAGRGKRVTLRDLRKDILADFIFGKPVEGKPGFRYVRVPGQKRTYAVKTDADPSARFTDWVRADLLRIPSASIRRVVINSYSIDERMGRLANLESLTLTQENSQWKADGAERINTSAVATMAATLDRLKIVDVRPKPPALAEDLRSGTIRLTLDAAMSLRQRGFVLSPNGRLLANEGEMVVETSAGLVYGLRFGEVATSGADTKPAAGAGENRYLLVTVNFDPARAAKWGEGSSTGAGIAKDLTNRYADWYYVISNADFQKLRLKRQDVIR